MKKLLFSFLIFTFCNLHAQIVNIPDPIFKNYLVSKSTINTNGDGEIQVSEAVAFTNGISIEYLNVLDLTGIEAFINLSWLICTNTKFTSMDVSKNTKLTFIYCIYTKLTSLDVSKNTSLTSLEWCKF